MKDVPAEEIRARVSSERLLELYRRWVDAGRPKRP